MRPRYDRYWLSGYNRNELRSLRERLEITVEYLSNSKDKLVINKLMDFPILRSLWLYHPTNYKPAAWAAIILFPIGLPVYFIGLRQLRILRDEIKKIISVADQLTPLIENPTYDE